MYGRIGRPELAAPTSLSPIDNLERDRPALPPPVSGLLSFRGDGKSTEDIKAHFTTMNNDIGQQVAVEEEIDIIVDWLIEMGIDSAMKFHSNYHEFEKWDPDQKYPGHMYSILVHWWNSIDGIITKRGVSEYAPPHLALSTSGRRTSLDAIGGVQDIHSPGRSRRRSVSRSRGRSRRRSRSRSYHRRTQRFLRKAIGKDDSSDEEEEYRRHDMSAMGNMLSRNGLKVTNAIYLPEPKVVIKLSEQARRSTRHPITDRPICLAVSQFDDKKWMPAYIFNSLSSTSRKDLMARQADISKEPTAVLLQRWLSFTMAHAAVGIISCEEAMQSVAIMTQISTCHGRDTAYGYGIRLSEYIKNQIASREAIDVGEVVSTKQEHIIIDIDRDLLRKNKKDAAKKTIDHQEPSSSYRGKSSSGKGRPPPHQGGGGGINRAEDHKHICFNHDPRKNIFCQDQTCRRQHLDTDKYPDAAEKFDRVKGIADARYAYRKGLGKGKKGKKGEKKEG